MVKLFVNSGDPDQRPHSAAPDLGLHCLPLLGLQTKMSQYHNRLMGDGS